MNVRELKDTLNNLEDDLDVGVSNDTDFYEISEVRVEAGYDQDFLIIYTGEDSF